jgi:hypothetical protein
MKRAVVGIAFAACLIDPASAVDNTLLVTPCAAGCVTTRSRDVGAGVQAPMPILSDITGTPIYGTAGAANTNILTVQGIAAMTPFLINPGTAANWGIGATAAAVPANAGYYGINVAGNLRGATGLALGSTFSQTVAIVDGTGAQITSFGGGGAGGFSYVTSTLTAWTSATANNAVQTLMPISTSYGAAVLVQLDQTTPLTSGAIIFEGTSDGTNWVSVPTAQIIDPALLTPIPNPYTLQASTNKPFLINPQGFQSLRIRLNPVIVGAGTVTPFVTLLPYLPVDPALLQPLATGSNVVGGVFISQVTPGTTNAVQTISGATGGATTTGNIAANNTTAVVVKASAGTLYGAQIYGIGAAPAYLKIYNAATATCGAGTPVKRLMIPAAATAANGAGSNISFGDVGVAFGTGITYCVTTGITDADATAPAANTYLVNLDWK